MALPIPSLSWFDWRIAALATMLMLTAYNLSIKTYFGKGHDWRALIPFVFAGVLLAFIYFMFTYKEIMFTPETPILAIAVLVSLVIATAGGWYAISQGPVSLAVAIFTFSTPLTALLAAYFLPGERLNAVQWLGVLLGVASVVLVTRG